MPYTWAQFKTKVKQLTTDVELNDTTAVLALSNFVKAGISIQVDKNPGLATAYLAMWEQQRAAMLGYTVTIGYEELRAAVNPLLTVDANRRGIYETGGFIDTLLQHGRQLLSGSGTWHDNQIKQAVRDIQHLIELYKTGHEHTYTVADVVVNQEACTLSLPAECMIRDVYYVKDDSECQRMPIQQYDWQNRFDLTCGAPRMTGHQFYAAVDPGARTLVLFPTLLDGYHLSLFYDGIKSDFADGDSVPFDEGCANAVALYLQWKMYLLPKTLNRALAEEYRKMFVQQRLALFSDAKDRQAIKFRNDSDSPLGTRCSCAICTSSDDEDDEDDDDSGTEDGCRATETYTVDNINGGDPIRSLKALPSNECRLLVFVLHPEIGFHKAYMYVHGDATADTGEAPFTEPDMIIPDDGLGRYYRWGTP